MQQDRQRSGPSFSSVSTLWMPVATATTSAFTERAARMSAGVSPMKQTRALLPSRRRTSAIPCSKTAARVSLTAALPSRPARPPQPPQNEPKRKYVAMPAARSFAQPIGSRLPEVTPSSFPAECRRSRSSAMEGQSSVCSRAALRSTSACIMAIACGSFPQNSSAETPAAVAAARRIPISVLPCRGMPSIFSSQFQTRRSAR